MLSLIPKKLRFVVLAFAGAIVISIGVAGQSSQPPPTQEAKRAKIPTKNSGLLPRADFGQAPRESPPKQILRQKRENRHKDLFPFISDPGRLVEGHQETAGLMVIDTVYMEESSEVPVSLATTIIVGTVLRGEGFVSQDRTYVYSDFEVTVEQIIKQDPWARINPGQSVVVSRTGATVYFPSGHIKKFAVVGQGMPKVASQYLLLLWRPNSDLPEYEILEGGAYELLQGKIYPLDQRGSKFEGSKAAEFVQGIRDSIRPSTR